ncbi:MAG TPA: glycosyltransferase family 2 protein [Bryobacteraceae bacterium]|nr:glycosyltransferase family 2 protein [Bryobacteraceae bacterium]
MSLTAIVPVWNGRDLLEGLLASVDAQTERPSEVLVVDNGSSDGAPELARGRGARVISMGRNAGFAAAVNRGIRESHTPWIAVLNSDVVLAPDYFATLMAAAAAFATGKIFSAAVKDRLDATFDAVCAGGTAWRVGQGRVDGPAFAMRREIFLAPWTALVLRADLVERVGLLDERFESYLEDVEFGLRCAAQGITGMYVPEAIAWHHGSATLGRWHPETVRRLARNQCYILALHYPQRRNWPVWVAQALWGGVAARHGAGSAWLRGKWQGFRESSHFRGRGPVVSESFLRQNERTIYEIQKAAGFDRYWQLYFFLTGRGTK